MKNKIRSIVMICFLAIAGIFGVSSALINKQVNETPVVEKADALATNFASGSSIYLRLDSSFTASDATCYIKVRSTGGDWRSETKVTATQGTKGGETLYVYTFSENVYEWCINRRNSGGTDNWGWSSTNITSHSHNLFTIYHHSDWGWDKQVEISEQSASITKFYFQTPSNGSVTITAYDSGSNNKGSISTNTLTYVYSDWHVKYSATPSTNYRLKTWTYSSSQSGTYISWDPENSNTNVTVYTNSDTYHSANFEIIKYNITYKRNNELSVADVVEQKNHGSNYTIKNPGTSPLNGSAWTTPGTYRKFGSWNTAADGSGSTVAAGAYSTNAALTLYYIPTWDLFEYSVDGGSSWVRLTLNNADKPSDAIAQFAPSSAQLLPYHATLSFRYSHDNGANWSALAVTTFSDGSKQNNYQPANGGIQIEVTDTIYLKYIYKDSSYYWDCWVPGITDYTIKVGDSTPYPLDDDGYSIGGKPQKKVRGSVYGEKDQIITAGQYGNYWRTYRNTDSNTLIEEKDGNLCFAYTGMYTVYLIEQVQGKWDSVYVEIDDSASANKWASVFMADVGCDPTGVSNPSGWSSCSTYYANLYGDTKDIIYSTTGNIGGTTLQQAVYRYDYAVSHHPSLTKFIVNSSSTPRAAVVIRDFSPISLFGGSEDNLSTVIIIVSSSVALLSITALSILVIKKRKNKEE